MLDDRKIDRRMCQSSILAGSSGAHHHTTEKPEEVSWVMWYTPRQITTSPIAGGVPGGAVISRRPCRELADVVGENGERADE